jgi:2-(1,2-epoxy-1,2-dihydrophenyl)acetyl-CoA isomerase
LKFIKKISKFFQRLNKIGLISDCGATGLLPNLIGFAKAKTLMLAVKK